jgi:hypothetical protein
MYGVNHNRSTNHQLRHKFSFPCYPNGSITLLHKWLVVKTCDLRKGYIYIYSIPIDVLQKKLSS